jgi:hypothetical protein
MEEYDSKYDQDMPRKESVNFRRQSTLKGSGIYQRSSSVNNLKKSVNEAAGVNQLNENLMFYHKLREKARVHKNEEAQRNFKF